MPEVDLTGVRAKITKKDCSIIDSKALSKVITLLSSNEKLDNEVEYIPVFTLNEKCNELSYDYGVCFENEDNCDLEEKENKVLRTEFSNAVYKLYNDVATGEEYLKLLSDERLRNLCPEDPFGIGMAKAFLLFKVGDKPIIELMREGREFHDFIPSISGLPLFGKQLDTDTIFNSNIYYTDNGDFYLCSVKGEGYNCSEHLERIYKVLVGQYDNEGKLSTDCYKYNQKASNFSSTKDDIAVLLSNFYTKTLEVIDYKTSNLTLESLGEISKRLGVSDKEVRSIFNSSACLFSLLIRHIAIYGYAPNYTHAYSYFSRNKDKTPNEFAKQTILYDGYLDRLVTGVLREKCGVETAYQTQPQSLYVEERDKYDYFEKLSRFISLSSTYKTFNGAQIHTLYNRMLLHYIYGNISGDNVGDALTIPFVKRLEQLAKVSNLDLEDLDRKVLDPAYPIEDIAKELSIELFPITIDSILGSRKYEGELSFMRELNEGLSKKINTDIDTCTTEELKYALNERSKAMFKYFMDKRMRHDGLGPKLRFTEEFQRVVAEGKLNIDEHLPFHLDITRAVLYVNNFYYNDFEPGCDVDVSDQFVKNSIDSRSDVIDALLMRREINIKKEEEMKKTNDNMRKEISENIAKFKTIETETVDSLNALAKEGNVVIEDEEKLSNIIAAIKVENNEDIAKAEFLEIDVEGIADEDLETIHKNVAATLKKYDAVIKKKVKEFETEFMKTSEVTKEELKEMKEKIKEESKKKEKKSEEKSENSSSSKSDKEERTFLDNLVDTVFSKEAAICAGVAAAAYIGYKVLKSGDDDEKHGEQGEIFLNGEENFSSIAGYNALARKFSDVASKETSRVVSEKASEVVSNGLVSKITGFFTGAKLFK